MKEELNKGTKKIFRIDGFELQRMFFKRIMADKAVTTSARAVYFYLWHLGNRVGWKEWFSYSLTDAMAGTNLSEKYFRKALKCLAENKLIIWDKGTPNKAGKIKLIYPLPDVSSADTSADTSLLTDVSSADTSGILNTVTSKSEDKVKTTSTPPDFIEIEKQKKEALLKPEFINYLTKRMEIIFFERRIREEEIVEEVQKWMKRKKTNYWNDYPIEKIKNFISDDLVDKFETKPYMTKAIGQL